MSVPNQAIEIHDSTLGEITLEAGVAVLHLLEVYIHPSDGRPAIASGSG